jgi:DNA-binding transcriptional LysR family regulator
MSRTLAPIHDIGIFVAVAQNSSFTRAAEQMGTSKSNAGKAVQRLEARLGTRLLQRSTRAVRLTEDGQIYLDAARVALEQLTEAEIALAARRDEPMGRVRLDIPIGFGSLLIPSFSSLRKQYPRVTLDLSLSDRQSDALGEGWDLVVRIGEIPGSGDMTVRKLCGLRNGLYASEDYLARHKPIESVADLQNQDAIIFRSGSGQLRPWSVLDAGRTVEISPNATVIVSDGRAMIDSAKSGLGIAQIFDRVAHSHVASGELVAVLPKATVRGPPVHALIPLGRRMPAKTRVVLDHLSRVFMAPV